MVKDFIKLKDVSKFYYNKGVIASGFNKISVSFKIGEFVAITGESGSGKSTLLNVLSGLDTYEEGEMYINGEETSHYTESDFEDYRRKYISNIYQSFNLVNSYSVYQNIELVLLLNGYKKRNIKKKVLDLIETVGLTKFKNTKVSKLSGGQKQRVGIARALAKETPVIIADEPTGNLDSKSAKEINALLNKIAKDKLVIVVTHNYEQIEDYVTRKIKMHDGKIIEDKVIKDTSFNEETTALDTKQLRLFSKIRLGVRNTYNIIPKFLLLLLVFTFISLALMLEYSSFKEDEYVTGNTGYNYYFNNTRDDRVIIKKKDKTAFSEEDYQNIESLDNVKMVVKNDLLLDNEVTFTNDYYWLYGSIENKDMIDRVDLGRTVENDNEIVIQGSKYDYYLDALVDEILDHDFYFLDNSTGEIDYSNAYKVVGIKYIENEGSNFQYKFYITSGFEDKLSKVINKEYSTVKVLFENKYYDSNDFNTYFKVIRNANVPSGEVYISSDLNYECKWEYCINHPLKIEVNNLYYSDSLNLNVTRVYTKYNFNYYLGLDNYDDLNGSIFVNPDDYNNMFNKSPYQSSVFVKDVKSIDETISILNDMGLETLKIKDTLMQGMSVQVLKIIRTVVTVILIVVLFFISYFVIKIILKSRNTYFATLRMLGSNKGVLRSLLIIELLTNATTSYALILGLLCLIKENIIKLSFLNVILEYFTLKEYVIIYVILLLVSYLISIRYARKIFSGSAMKSIREEV